MVHWHISCILYVVMIKDIAFGVLVIKEYIRGMSKCILNMFNKYQESC